MPTTRRAEDLLSEDFGTLPDLVRLHGLTHPDKPAVIDEVRALSYAELDDLVDRIAASLQREGLGRGDVVAICAASSVNYAAAFLGILRAGGTVAPLAPSSTAEALLAQLRDCGARVLLLDAATGERLAPAATSVEALRVALDDSTAGDAFTRWLAPAHLAPQPVMVEPDQVFNIIYSSGTTGSPKGIMQPHSMRWAQLRRVTYPDDAVTLLSTPLYSNTTLVSFLPTLAIGGTVVLMAKFEAATFLRLSAQYGVTHTMLVPVQYRRLMDHPTFDDHDLSAYRMKYCTSAPFSAALKAEILRRWPGGLIEFYGMTEGGGTCALACHDFPDKLATVGRPLPDHDIRLIDEAGVQVLNGGAGEVVGRSGAMMVGYHNQTAKTAEAEWWSPDGERFIRTGDVGRFDADGFLTLMDRKKDMIISGGFNIYPSDLEAVLHQHPQVQEAAVVGLPSEAWGETPVAFVARRSGATIDADDLRAFANDKVGKTQRLSALVFVDQLPRSPIGKVLKRELRDAYVAQQPSA